MPCCAPNTGCIKWPLRPYHSVAQDRIPTHFRPHQQPWMAPGKEGQRANLSNLAEPVCTLMLATAAEIPGFSSLAPSGPITLSVGRRGLTKPTPFFRRKMTPNSIRQSPLRYSTGYDAKVDLRYILMADEFLFQTWLAKPGNTETIHRVLKNEGVATPPNLSGILVSSPSKSCNATDCAIWRPTNILHMTHRLSVETAVFRRL